MQSRVLHRPQIPALTGLRFFAAFFILFAHASDWCAPFQDSNVKNTLGLLAMYGMPLFFVLSGFVIHYNYAHLFATRPLGNAVAEFAWTRFARLYPLYLFMLVFAICVDGFAGYMLAKPSVAIDVAVYFLTLTQSWVYALWDGRLMAGTLFGLAWSISTEAFFYVAYVALVFVLLKLARPRNIFWVSVIYAVAVMGGLLWLLNWVSPADAIYYRWLFYYSPYVRVFEFVMGCLAAQTFIRLRDLPVSGSERTFGAWVLGASLAFLVMFGLIRAGFIVLHPLNGMVNQLTLNFLFGPACAALMFCACRYETWFARLMALPALVALGETSYSIYRRILGRCGSSFRQCRRRSPRSGALRQPCACWSASPSR